MSVLLENHLQIVQCAFNGVDNVFNECMVMQDIVQRLVKTSPNNNGKNLVQEIETNQMIWKEKMSNLHQWLIDAVNKVSQLIKTYSNTKEYHQDLQINQISLSQPAPFDRIDVCFEKYAQFINMVQVFKLQNSEMYERGLSSGTSFESNKRFIAVIFDSLQQFLTDFISKFIIVTKQPPFCILRDATNKNSDDKNLKNVTNKLDPSKEMPKCQKAFDLELKIYSLYNVLEFVRFNNGKESIRPIVEALIVGEDDYIKWMNGGRAPTPMGTLSETVTKFEMDNRVYTAIFSNMRINKIIRQVTEGKKKIEEMRFCIMFGIRIGTIELPGWNGSMALTNQAISLPFVLVSNPVQRKAAFPCVCWCRAFNQMENYQIDFKTDKREIDWIKFKYSLNDVFCTATNCGPLKDFQLYHLGELLFENEYFDDTDRHVVTFQKFLNTPLSSNKGSNILFWDWFYSTIDFIGNKKIKPYWIENLLCGFMSRETAEMILKQQNQPSMLIRFSDSVIGGVVFSVILPNNNNEVMHMFLEETLCNEYISLYQCYERLCEKYEDMKKIKVICSGPGQFESMEKFKSIQLNKKVEKENDKVSDAAKFKYFLVQKKLILKEGIGVKKIKEILTIIKSKQCPAGAIGSAEVTSSLEEHMNNLDSRSCSSNASACSAEILSELTESDRSIIHQFFGNNFPTNWTRGESSDSAFSDNEMHEDDYTPHQDLVRTPSADVINQFIYLNNEDQLPEIRYVDQYFYNPQNSIIPQNNFSSL